MPAAGSGVRGRVCINVFRPRHRNSDAHPKASPMKRLKWTDTNAPGIARRRAGRGWTYIDPEGATITCPEMRARLSAIALPPAYQRAWYNPDPDGHILAVGIDARGRRQYRYHPDFRSAQESEKFDRLSAFGGSLPKLRQAVTTALRQSTLSRERVIAAIVRLLDMGQLRVGNESYARDNKSYGATTLRSRHATMEGPRLRLKFRGKSGIERTLTLSDRSLVRTVRQCQDLPGQHLFAWEDSDGRSHPVNSDDVNGWLRETSGLSISARQFRTWWASVLALECCASTPPATLAEMLTCVSARLGNTPAIARKSYIHPAVIEIARGEREPAKGLAGPQDLSGPERRLMALLKATSG